MTERTTPSVLEQADYAAVHADIVALLEVRRIARGGDAESGK